MNDAEKNNVTALWALTASGYNTVSYTTPLDDTTPVTCDVTKTYGASDVATAADLPNSDKAYVICVKLVDTAGNITYGKSQMVERDTTLPTVNAGSDVIVNATHNSNTTTSGATTYLWSQESGLGTITFGSATVANTTVSADTDGVYVIRLTVSDAAGNASYDELNFTWSTNGPIVSSFVGANEAVDGYLNAAEVRA